MKALIQKGLVIDPVNDIKEKLDILIENGKIAKISKNIKDEADYVIDASGMIVSPGFVDLHANFNDPGSTGREDLKSGCLAAAKGGYTHVVLGTGNKPAPSESNVIDYILKYKDIMPINIYPSAAVTVDRDGMEMADINFLYSHGAIGFYDGQNPIVNKNLLTKIMLAVKKLNKPLSIYSETETDERGRGILETAKTYAGSKFVTDIDSEVNDLKENIELAKLTKVKLDLAYVTSPESIEIVNESKEEYEDIYAEVPVLNLICCDKDVKKFEGIAKVLPPLRSETDRKALCKAIKKSIDIISSNHSPIENEEKEGKIKDAVSGATTIEFTLGIIGTTLVDKSYIDWTDVIEKISINPAKLYNLDKDGVGRINLGDTANITIFDPNEEWKVTEDQIVSKSKKTPIIGETLIGKVKYTICNGRLVYRDVAIAK